MASPPEITNKTQIWRMKVQSLRDALEARGLDSSGDQMELKKRLKTAIFPEDLNSQSSSQSNVAVVANNLNSSQLDDLDEIKISKGPVYKRIPKASRLHASIAFNKVVQDVIDKNDKHSWSNLLNFATCAIGSSTRGGKKKRKSQATTLNKRIEAFMAGSPEIPINKNNRKPPSLKNLVSVKMALADIQGAVRILTSNDSILPPTQDTINLLKEKHPQKHTDSSDPPIPNDDCNTNSHFQTNREKLLKAIHSFPMRVAGGPDGLSPQHLKEMCGESLGEPASKLVDTLVNFMNIIIFPGKVPAFVKSTFYGANLIALSKPDGGARPIAIGFILRRLAAKIIMYDSRDFCDKEFRPHQVGVGTPNGCEAAVHALRAYLTSQTYPQAAKVILKIDFKNAFNSIRRDVILQLVKSKMPKVYNFIYQCYAHESKLDFGSEFIGSCEGVQQGDPLGPFLFSLGIQDIITRMKSEFNCWYLNDRTLGGDVNTVFQDAAEIMKMFHSHGLKVNPTKSELFFINDQSREATNVLNVTNLFNSIMDGIKIVNRSDLTLLGSPIFPEAINSVLDEKLSQLSRMSKRLLEIENHEALFLQRHWFTIPKFNYFLRTSPCLLKSDTLEKIDKIVKESLENILNIDLHERAYDQATLPIAMGGLGFRPATEVALAGFLSSVCASKSISRSLLPPSYEEPVNRLWESACTLWKQKSHQNDIPEITIYQSTWDKELYDYRYQNLLHSSPDNFERARLLAVSSKSASDWLYAVPIPSLGLKLDPMTLKISCCLRLGSTVCHQYQCICGAIVESNGRHGLSCKNQYLGRKSRHDEINNLMKRALVQAKIPAINEPSNLSRKDGKRPDGLTLTTWKTGKCLIWDATVADSLCDSYVNACAKNPGAAAEAREGVKNAHYKELANNYCFVPVGVETFGSWGPEGHKLIKEIGRKVMEETGEKRSSFYFFQKLSMSVQRGNASCIIGTIPRSEGLDEIFDFVSVNNSPKSQEENEGLKIHKCGSGGIS